MSFLLTSLRSPGPGRWLWMPLFVGLVTAAACGDDAADPDAGMEADAGPVAPDAAPMADGGGELDAGSETDGGPRDGGAALDAGARVTWENGMGIFFGEQCAGCHRWANTYDGVVAKILDGSMRIRAEAGHRMTSAQAEALLAWIDDDYPEN